MIVDIFGISVSIGSSNISFEINTFLSVVPLMYRANILSIGQDIVPTKFVNL